MKEGTRERNTTIEALVQTLNQTSKHQSSYHYFLLLLLLYYHFQHHQKTTIFFIINCSFVLSSNLNLTLTSKSQDSPKPKTPSPPLILLLEREALPKNSSFRERKFEALSMNQSVKFYFLRFAEV